MSSNFKRGTLDLGILILLLLIQVRPYCHYEKFFDFTVNNQN